jgi:uncharacterized membrane protein YvlD (DUF360 family)
VRVTLLEIAWGLTALAAVVVVLTRIRLSSSDHRPAGRFDFARGILTTHTTAGVIALGLWVPALYLASMPLALLAIGAWWIVTIAGLLLLARWLPSGGKHSIEAVEDEWTSGPWLSMLAHLGMLGGASYFTWLVLMPGL